MVVVSCVRVGEGKCISTDEGGKNQHRSYLVRVDEVLEGLLGSLAVIRYHTTT